ncbi:hypothetical protein MML48_9g00018364 [Holotrichia oblita]|uniref:Uncharacterized protein n=1 Tax=Holotrichia oblita TaxID=644536 RepID=A0ACB9SKD6_HOLOL|nr:hypothetical protein MML48_9g00018364 [Holotrichia oblita]
MKIVKLLVTFDRQIVITTKLNLGKQALRSLNCVSPPGKLPEIDIEVKFDVNSDDSDEEFAEYINNLRPYIVRRRIDNMHKWTDEEFFKRFRLTKNSVNELLQRIQHMIVNRTNRNKALTPMQQLLLTLRFYATGNFYLGAGDLGGNPNPEVFRNRKGYFSLNIQIVGNAKYFINDLVVRWPGSAHDSYIFDNSRVRARFENGDFRASVLLGDSGYPLRNYLMTPLANPRTPAEQLYNESQIRTRTIIERIIGIWKRRFPVLTVGLRCKIPLAQDIILATAILHNIARKANEPDFIDVIEDVIVHEDEQQQIIEQQVINNNVQRDYINYFEQLL